MPPENNVPPSPQVPVPTDSKATDFFPPKIFIILILLAGILGSYQVFYSAKSEKVENLEVKEELMATDTSTWKTYIFRKEDWSVNMDRKEEFEFKYPDDWRIDGEYYTLLMFSVSGEKKAKEEESICIKKLVNADSSVCASPYLQDLTFFLSDPSIPTYPRDNIKEIKIGDFIWVRYERGGYVYYELNKDSEGYTFSFKNDQVANQILSTFKFISTSTEPTIYDDSQKLEYGYNLKRYKALFASADYTNADIVWIDKDGKETLILKNIKQALPELQESPLIGLSKLSYPENSNKLYFYTYRDSSDGPPMDVYEFNLDTIKFNKRPVATEYYSNFGTRSVSLNGKFIATTENPKDGSDNKSIFLINLETDTVKKIVTVGKNESTSYCSREGDCWGYHTHNLKWVDDWTLEYDVYDTTKLVGDEYVKDYPLLEKRKVIIQ